MPPFFTEGACRGILAFCAIVAIAVTCGASTVSDEDWITFFREAAPMGFVISVNQAVTSGRIVPTQGNCYEIRFEFQPAQLANNGMPNKEAQAVFYGIEDALGKLIASDDGQIVATQTGQKMRSIWLCGSNTLASKTQSIVKATKTVTAALRPSSLAEIKALHPTKIEGHLAHDETVFDTLTKQGDDHSIPRKIDHFIYGTTATNRKTIEARLRHIGFQIDSEQLDAIRFFRISPIELDAIQSDTRTLLELCDEFGCEYDGWGTEIKRTVN
jgi:regulator of RNase E activity RraB